MLYFLEDVTKEKYLGLTAWAKFKFIRLALNVVVTNYLKKNCRKSLGITAHFPSNQFILITFTTLPMKIFAFNEPNKKNSIRPLCYFP